MRLSVGGSDSKERYGAAEITVVYAVLFCDTDAFATQLWERRYLGTESTAAYDALSPTMQVLCAGLTVRHHRGRDFDDRVDQDGLRGALEVFARERPLDQESTARRDLPGAGQAQVGRVGGDTITFDVGATRGGINL